MTAQPMDDPALWLARRAVEHERPDELPLFDTLAFRLKDDVAAARLKPSEEHPLGFGVSDAVEFLSPIAVAAGVGAVAFLYEIAKDATLSAATMVLRDRIKSWLDEPTREPAPQLPPELLQHLHTTLTAELEARYPGLEHKAVVDRVVAAMAMGALPDGDAR